MTTNKTLNVVKRIAFVASESNRKSLIEWSYYNQEILRQHELIAAGTMADILEGTIGVPVKRLAEGYFDANHQLASMIASQQIDILLFFWDPAQPLSNESSVRALYDMAITSNIIIAGNQPTADFVLSSALMEKTHLVKLSPDVRTINPVSRSSRQENRRVVMKVNTIN